MDIGNFETLIHHLYATAMRGQAEVPRVNRYAPVLVWGEAGVGKSETINRVSKQLGIGFRDLRLGQLDVGDLIGLPRTEETYPCVYDLEDPEVPGEMKNRRYSKQGLLRHLIENYPEKIGDRRGANQDALEVAIDLAKRHYGTMIEFRTVYATPEWFPAPNTSGILLLDELNRARRDVLQAVFQLILDRRMHDMVLPPGWIILSANNPPDSQDMTGGGTYQVNDVSDKAFLSRFLHVALQPRAEEWLDYARHHGIDTSIIAVISAQTKLLGVGLAPSLPDISPTPRSWTILNKILPGMPPGILEEVALGLIGSTATSVWKRLMMSPEPPVSGKELLEDYQKVRPRLLSFVTATNDQGDESPRLDMVYATFESLSGELGRYEGKPIDDPRKSQQIMAFLEDATTSRANGGLGVRDIALNYLKLWMKKYRNTVAKPVIQNPNLVEMVRQVMRETGQTKRLQDASRSGSSRKTYGALASRYRAA